MKFPALGLRTSTMVGPGVTRDTKDPLVESGTITQLIYFRIHPNEYFLGQVSDLVAFPHFSPEEGRYDRDMPRHETFERTLVPITNLLDEFFVRKKGVGSPESSDVGFCFGLIFILRIHEERTPFILEVQDNGNTFFAFLYGDHVEC